MSESFLAIILWYSPDRKYGYIADLGGNTYLFKEDCLTKDFVPTPSVVVLFRVEFLENGLSRSGYKTILVEPADLQSVNEDDLETLTREYAAHCEKESRKRQHREQRYDSYKINRGKPEHYGIVPLKNKWSD